jgi:PAS domain S-box-containing protein
MDPQQLSQSLEHHDEIMRTGRPIETEEHYRDARGELRHLHVIKSPVFDAGGKVTGSQGVLMDITQLKHAEARLKYERKLLRTLMDKSEDCIYFKDVESRFIRCSSSMCRIFKVASPEELVGRRDGEFFSEAHAREAYEDEQKILRTGEPVTGKVEMETWRDGRVTWALTSKMPFHNEAGEITGTFGISKDITAIKEAEEQLGRAHQQLVEASRQAGMAEVATSVLHNVGNVLNSVNVSSSLIADKMGKSKVANLNRAAALIQAHEQDLGVYLSTDPKGRQLPAYLIQLAAHLAQEQQDILQEVGTLVSNVIHIKEIVAMQQNYAKSSGVLERLHVTDLVEDALRMNTGAMSRHHVEVVRRFAEVPPILTEKHKILQILVNLIRNAKYACDDSGRDDKRIILHVADSGGTIKISVEDNGIGIAPENLTRIFGHGFTTRKEGHGFGLHSGALAAKELGGALTVASGGPNCGATFTLELPVNRTPKNL